MAFTSSKNRNVVETVLDNVFYQEWNFPRQIGYVDADSALIFRQKSTDRAAEIEENFKGVGLWKERAEEQDVPQDEPLITDKITFNVVNYAEAIDISKNFFDDNMHNAYEYMVQDFARKGKLAQTNNAMAHYRNSFTTTLTADGVALISDSHTLIGGGTEDNKITSALDEASLNEAIIKLGLQKDQAGVIAGHQPHCLLVPLTLFKTACEIVESDYRSQTADNDMNVYSSKYGIYVATSNYLDAANPGGSDTAWWLLSRTHGSSRWVRQGIETNLVPYQYQRNNNYIYKGEFRETYGAVNFGGIVGSDGTT